MAVSHPLPSSTGQRSRSSSSARSRCSTSARRARARCTSARSARSRAASRRPTSSATRGRSTSSAATARTSGTSTATSTTTSTTASARWSRATPTRRSARAISERYSLGTHFAAPTEDAIVVGEELSRRWDLPRWRYTNSGSESTMDAIRIARAYTKRETIMKIFGSYHGHHDGVMVSIGVEYDKIGDRFNLESLAYGAGIPQAVVDLTIAVPFNDPRRWSAASRRSIAEGRKPACVIMEAAMMNLGIVLPEPGYLEADARDHAAPRHRPDLRRGQDRALHRGRRRDRALGRDAGHGHARQGARRRPALGRDRRLARRSCRWWRTAASSRSAPTTATRSAWRPRARTCSRSSRPTPTRTSTRSTTASSRAARA